ncbi:MAG: L-2-hydroxyglutarate oxidase [Planctomycetota bacterium]|nr:MAG: L-2-hydroxyglutarate oxidase [Planctomycetota bacterium]
MPRHDVVIIGGGIVGLATAYQLLQRRPGTAVEVLEKESAVGRHQSGHNSGVLHSGIYYQPGSEKARNCREGKRAMEEFCGREGIPFEICGKLIVAVDAGQLPALERILQRGLANGVRCQLIERERLAELEPHAAGVRAIHVPEAGIVDYKSVCSRLRQRIEEAGGSVCTGARVTRLWSRPESVVVESDAGPREAVLAVNCAGLHSDRVARRGGRDPGARIVPFRGEYYELKPQARGLCRNLIYPVPDPSFPFLGVHFTRTIGGGVECGPNAVLAFAREGYRKRDVNLRDLFETLTYPGFLRLAARHWRTGAGEMWRSFSKSAFVRALQRLVPEIRAGHLEPAPAGVRAQALRPDGSLVDDFLILESERVLHVCNAPSPAATASLQIGAGLAARILPRLT